MLENATVEVYVPKDYVLRAHQFLKPPDWSTNHRAHLQMWADNAYFVILGWEDRGANILVYFA
ncbi:hypothetical protein GC173_07220 [bacterium]|nr:hypothetical protein [bacterium]